MDSSNTNRMEVQLQNTKKRKIEIKESAKYGNGKDDEQIKNDLLQDTTSIAIYRLFQIKSEQKYCKYISWKTSRLA